VPHQDDALGQDAQVGLGDGIPAAAAARRRPLLISCEASWVRAAGAAQPRRDWRTLLLACQARQ
jgi:hypothetical protein